MGATQGRENEIDAPAGQAEHVAEASPGADSRFAIRLTDLANAEHHALCDAIMAKALDGERWAVELVVRYVFARTGDGEDALRALLEELRERTARGA